MKRKKLPFKHMARLFKRCRVKNQIPQTELSEYLGFNNNQQVSDIENGKELLSIRHHKRFSQGFQIKLELIKKAYLADIKIKYENEV